MSIYLFSLAQKHLTTSFTVSIAISIGFVLIFVLLISLFKSPQCIFFLLIPQFFSKRGRTAIVAYTFFIALNGPAANLMKNFHVMSDCMACGQDQLKLAMYDLVHAVKEPYYTIKEAVEKIIPLIKNAMEKIKQTAVELKDRIVGIGKLSSSVYATKFIFQLLTNLTHFK